MSPARVWKLYQTLSNDECARVLRDGSEHGFRRHVCSQGVLREVLSTYTGVAPWQLRIEQGRGGKPFLAASSQYDHLRFSLSHADEVALFAITWGGDIGVDVELVAPRHADPELWETVLTPAELERLRLLPDAERPAAFARTWTQKEAVLKATGRGLAYSMKRIELEPSANGATGTMELDGTWNILDIPAPDEGFVASIATRASHPQVLARMAPGQDDLGPHPTGRTV